MEGQNGDSMNETNFGADLDEVFGRKRQNVMVVDDEPDTAQLLKHILRAAGYNVLGALNGQEAIHKFSETRPQLVLLDLMMPGMDGWQTFEYLRKMSDVPVIVISAISGKDEVVRALRLGADDYICKPFVNAEVIARVEAILRRANNGHENLDRMAFPEINLLIDFHSQEIQSHDQRLQLTGREFAIIGLLARSAPALVSYHDLAMQIWEEDTAEARNRIKYLVHLLRRKFDRLPGKPDFIQNIDRIGYKLRISP